ncbi:YitT family protein [Clostridium guangxiense]|uniref:YitT family protein n=1 Tax=Clostridium guangxiense TaxID=1662055 RepID=UPI002ED931A6
MLLYHSNMNFFFQIKIYVNIKHYYLILWGMITIHKLSQLYKDELFTTILKKYLFLTCGCILFSIYASILLTPSKIGTGGILGICLSLNHLFNFKIGITTIILNVPLFLFGFRLLGKNFAIKSAFIVIISSMLIDYMNLHFSNYHFIPTSDKLTSAIFCGVVSGIGMSMIFMGGGSTGGLDICAKMIKNRTRSIPLSKIMLYQDIIVYIFVGIVLGPQSVLYALIMSFIRSKTIDTIQEGFSSSRQCFIICNKSEEITSSINIKLNRGVTKLDAVGGYSHLNKKVLYVVIQKYQLSALRLLLKEIEPTAFITVSPVNDILGNYKQSTFSV